MTRTDLPGLAGRDRPRIAKGWTGFRCRAADIRCGVSPMRREADGLLQEAIDAGSLVHSDTCLVTRRETFTLHALSTSVRRVADNRKRRGRLLPAGLRSSSFREQSIATSPLASRPSYCGCVDCAGSPTVMVCVSSPHVVLAGLLKSSPL